MNLKISDNNIEERKKIATYLDSLNNKSITPLESKRKNAKSAKNKSKKEFEKNLLNAMKANNPKEVLKLLNDERSFIWKVESRIKGKTPLMWASQYKKIDDEDWFKVIKYFICIGASVTKIANSTTPLLCAVEKKDKTLIAYYLKFIAKSSKNEREQERVSLKAAIVSLDLDIVTMLVTTSKIPIDQEIIDSTNDISLEGKSLDEKTAHEKIMEFLCEKSGLKKRSQQENDQMSDEDDLEDSMKSSESEEELESDDSSENVRHGRKRKREEDDEENERHHSNRAVGLLICLTKITLEFLQKINNM